METNVDDVIAENDNQERQQQAETQVALQRELGYAMEFMGPMQLATVLTVAITDSEYLKQVIMQMTNNLNGRL